MEVKMQQNDTSILGFIVTAGIWVWAKIFALIGMPTIAEFASICVVISACWTIVANSAKAVENLEKFREWLKKEKDDETQKP